MRIIGNESTGYKLIRGTQVLAFAPKLSLLLIIAAHRGWQVSY